ncbi:efflux transporter outer membrane subunit [Collimonas silvisoli]|uniref:efflux transporter outer membrane subunit n=1 Tax=Collimonas silvisoli TaxID=2825884 RepID=UPI002E77613C|nr:efflux transporter outer membrane subunit [Collimonas silvisoli]
MFKIIPAVMLLIVAMSGCALQKPYQAPEISLAKTWQAELPHGGRTQELLKWWGSFDDPAVAELISIAENDSPTLAQAVAQIDGARATLTSSGAAAWPSVTGSGALTRSNTSSSSSGVSSGTSSVVTARSGELDASWDIDLFGKIRSSRESAHALLQARIDDWHDARVSLAAEVADDYVQYRACKLLLKAYVDTATSQSKTMRSTRAAVTAGLSAESDGYLAEANAASAAANVEQQSVSCEELVKSLVAVTGADETALRRIIDRPEAPALPEPANFNVSSIPADLIRQRPDLASAERTLASYYAAIGEARADKFPSLTLSGTIGVSASNLTSPSSPWSFGPGLSVPIFDAGKRKAAVDSAQATYDAQLASYRSSVRSAVKAVEQALVDLKGAMNQSEHNLRSAQMYRRYAVSVEKNWSAGLETLLTLEDARRSTISAEVTLIGQQRDRVRYWIALYKALGGGWSVDDGTLPPVTQTTSSLQGVV